MAETKNEEVTLTRPLPLLANRHLAEAQITLLDGAYGDLAKEIEKR